jgi:DNA helicase IV
MWPILSAEDLLNDLFGARALLALATRDILAVDERDALWRERAHTIEEASWSAADIPLLDEARALLGPPRQKRTEDSEPRGYGHIVVDETQDVSPMALRMLGRRSVSGSMTLVGDIAQATSSTAASGWDQVLANLPARRPPRMTLLTVNYRTPAEIMEVATPVLEAAEVVGAVAPRSVRATGRMPFVRATTPQLLADEVAMIATAELAAVQPGTVAVIAAGERLAELESALDGHGAAWGSPERTGLSAPITLLDVPNAKGLEFDSVVVVEPAELAGLQALYVALTRATRRLSVVHAAPLPPPVVEGLTRARTSAREGPD